MSKRAQPEPTKMDEGSDSQPVRRSSRISSGLNSVSSPAPKAITTRRNSANSNVEKNNVEVIASPMDRRRTRRTSTDEEIKPASTRSRRGSISKVIEEEKLATPNSPSRRTTRLSNSSPSLDIPARRTRRSSQDSETVEIPARRITRRSSTGSHEIVEEVEKAKPLTRRRRSTSVDEQEENVKVETKPKIKRLFDESHLEPIKEQEQEEKKTTVQEDTHTLEPIEELTDEIGDRVLQSLNEELNEMNKKDENSNSEEERKIPSNEKAITTNLLEKSVSVFENDIHNETSTGKNESKEANTETEDNLLENIQESAVESVLERGLETSTKNFETSPDSNEIASSTKNSVELKQVINIVDDESPTLHKSIVSSENVGVFSSPGSDKENTFSNIPQKNISLKCNEDLSFVKKTPENSLCEPMEVDDEDDLFENRNSETEPPNELIVNGTPVREIISKAKLLEKTSPKVATCPEEIVCNQSISDDSVKMHGSFSELNSSPDKESPQIKESKSPILSSTRSSMGLPSALEITEAENDDDSEDESIKLVDTDEEEEEEAKQAALDNEKHTLPSTTETSDTIEQVNLSALESSILDKSFGSEKNSTLDEKKSDESLAESEPIDEPASSEATVVEGKENNLDKSKMDSVSEEVSKVATESNESVDVAVSEHKDKAHIIEVSSENFSVEAEIVDTISPRGEKIENVSEETNEIIYSNSRPQSAENSIVDSSIVETSKIGDEIENPSEDSIIFIDDSSTIVQKIEIDSSGNVSPKSIGSGNLEILSEECSEVEFSTTNGMYRNNENSSTEFISPSKIILTSVEVIKQKESNSSTKIQDNEEFATKLRNSLAYGEINENTGRKQESIVKSRHSLPSAISKLNTEESNTSEHEEETIYLEKTSTSDKFEENGSKVEESPEKEIVVDSSGEEDDNSALKDDARTYLSNDLETQPIDNQSEHCTTKTDEKESEPENSEKESEVKKEKTPKKENKQMAEQSPSCKSVSDQRKSLNSSQSKIESTVDSEEKSEISVIKEETPKKVTEQQIDEQTVSKKRISLNSSVSERGSKIDSEETKTEHVTKDKTPKRDTELLKVDGSDRKKRISLNSISKKESRVDSEEENKSMEQATKYQTPRKGTEQQMDEQPDHKKRISLISSSRKKESRFDSEEAGTEKVTKDKTPKKGTELLKVDGSDSKKRISLNSSVSKKRSRVDSEEDNKSMEQATKDETPRKGTEQQMDEQPDHKKRSLISSLRKKESRVDLEEAGTEKVTKNKTPKKGTEQLNIEKSDLKKGKSLNFSHNEKDTDKTTKKRNKIFDEKTNQILAKSGIAIEDEENAYFSDRNEFLDEFADEAEEGSFVEEESDDYEIKDEGESVFSESDEQSEQEDGYDFNDSFINDEEEEILLSGEEDFLGDGKKEKKKYKKIIPSESTSSSDNDKTPEAGLSSRSEAEPISVKRYKPDSQEEIKTFEEQVDSLIRSDCNAQNGTTDTTNTSQISETSVIMQETCRVSDVKTDVLVGRIQNVVDVFCKNIPEPIGNISLNVSLNYKPGDVSLEKIIEVDNSTKSDSSKPPRLSSESRKRTSLSSADVQENLVQSEQVKVHKTPPGKSLRLSKEKRTSTSPKRSKERQDALQECDKQESIRLILDDTKKNEIDSKSNLSLSSHEQEIKSKKRSRRRKKKHSGKESVSEESCIDDHNSKKSRSSSKDEKSRKEINSQPHKKDKINKKEYSYDKDPKQNREIKRKGTKTTDESESVPEKKKIKFDKYSKVPCEIKKNKSERGDEKKEKRKHDSCESEVPCKKLCSLKDVASGISKHFKEIKPVKSKSRSDECVKRKSKTEFKASYSNKKNDWEEVESYVEPSAANLTISGFNLESIDKRDFKNTMIYDSTRNRRVPSVKSKRSKK